MKESCWLYSYKYFSFKCIPNYVPAWKISKKKMAAVGSGGSINRKLDCSARFGPSSDQSSLPSIARSLPSDNENKHDETAAILKDTSDRQETLLLTSGVDYSV